MLILSLREPWTMAELLEVYKQAQHLFDQSTGVIHSLVDLTEMGSVPANALSGRRAPFLDHINHGRLAVIGGSSLARALTEVAFRITRNEQVRFFDDRKLAIEYLHPESTSLG